MNYSLFSRGYSCKDVCKRATFESYNRTIKLFEVAISPEDLIFAGNDCIVVIPFLHEKEIMKKIIEKVSIEHNVSRKVTRYLDPMEIVKNIGEF